MGKLLDPMSSANLAEFAQTLFEEAGDALFLFDPNTEEMLEVNPTTQKLSGFPRAELLQFRLTQILRSQTPGGTQRLRQAFRETGLFHSRDGFLLRHRREGVWVPVNITVARLHIRPKTVGLVTARDITERREAELALQGKEAELQCVLRSVSDFLWSTEYDPDGRPASSYRSPAVEALTGLPPAAFGTDPESWLRIVHPMDRSTVGAAFSDARRGRLGDAEYEYRVLRPSGEARWVRDRWRVTRPRADSGVRIDGVGSDVTNRKAVEDSLRDSEARYRSLIENMEQGVFLKDRDLRFVTVNWPFCRTAGGEPSEVVGSTDFDWFPRDFADQSLASDRRVLTTGEKVDEELELFTGTGCRRLHVFKGPVLGPENDVVGVQGTVWDVTAQRSVEAQLRQAQKMEIVGQLAGGVAHDFNNLLTVILGNLSVVLNDPTLGAVHHGHLVPVEMAAARAAELTGQLLSFSRRNALRTKPTDLNVVVADAVNIVRRTTSLAIELETRPAPDLWSIDGDPGQMTQILINLCLNARDAMPGGGRLTIETANVIRSASGPRAPDAQAGAFIRLSVTDTGQGIPPDVRDRIFEPFFTTKEPGKGTGLGLSMVSAIVQQHRGWIECLSDVGAGTRFDLYFPHNVRVGTEPPAPAPDSAPVDRGSETILLVDDEAMIRNLARQILVGRGYRVLLAEDGVEALEIYGREARKIDLVIMDVNMPRLSGIECARRLREVDPNVRILISSGYATDLLSRANDSHFSALLNKPYRVDQLLRAVRDTLDRGVASPGVEEPANSLSSPRR